MARLSTVRLAVLNIVTHPHSTGLYAEIFWNAYLKQKTPFKLRGDYYGLVQSCFPVDQNNLEAGFEGDLIRFLQIKTDEPWFNLKKVDFASADEMKEIHIPEHLRPHSQKLRYVFSPKDHRLVYVEHRPQANLSPSMAKNLIGQFLTVPNSPAVTVTIEQSKEVLDEILRMANLRELKIVIDRPNADDFSNFEKALTESLEQQHVKGMKLDLIAESGKSLIPDQDNVNLARVAVSNGLVEAKGTDENGKKVEVSTADHPFLARYKIVLDKVGIAVWLKSVAGEVIKAVKSVIIE